MFIYTHVKPCTSVYTFTGVVPNLKKLQNVVENKSIGISAPPKFCSAPRPSRRCFSAPRAPRAPAPLPTLDCMVESGAARTGRAGCATVIGCVHFVAGQAVAFGDGYGAKMLALRGTRCCLRRGVWLLLAATRLPSRHAAGCRGSGWRASMPVGVQNARLQ